MRLIEATCKEILAGYGLEGPKGRLCSTADQAGEAATELGGAVYVKAQIPFGDRAGLGLITRADDPDAAARDAETVLGRSVDGQAVGAVLVEAAIDADLSAYVGIHVDDETASRILSIGLGGGGGYRPEEAEIQLSVPLGGPEIFELRKLVGETGLVGAQREALTGAAMAVVRAAHDWHAYTVEVNPLFITAEGAVAIDAKAELDPYSLKSVPDPAMLPEQAESPREHESRLFQERDHRGSFRFVQLVDDAEADGEGGPLVGSHSVGGGESLVVFDALDAVGLRPANYCDTSGAPSREKVAFAAGLIAAQPHIEGFFFSSCIANQPLSVTAGGLIDGFEAAGWQGPTVIRIAGNEEEQAREMMQAWADEANVAAIVVGREVDEWEAARMLADELSEGGP